MLQIINGDLLKGFEKKLAKKGGKYILTLLAPYLPVIGFVFLMFMLLAMLVGAVYSAFPDVTDTGRQVGILADVDVSPEDEKMYKQYNELVDEYNVKNTWLVDSQISMPHSSNKMESSPEHPFYPGTGAENIGSLQDRYGNDYKLRLLWSQVHASALYRALSRSEENIPPAIMEKTTKDLQPYFYYKRSQVVSCDKDGDRETTIVYLLVEAFTIQGHYQYHYDWTTKTYPEGGSVTYEELRDTAQILPNKWQRLETWMQEEYEITDEAEASSLARVAVWEAAQGFNKKQEWMTWLINSCGDSWVSGAMVPGGLMPYFQEASEKYGIPSWFLQAIALRESSFDPQAENSYTACYGLMQIAPANWPIHSATLGFDPVLDRDNPRAQIMVGTYMLYELGLKSVDWDAPNWQEQTLPSLAFYGGYGTGKAAQESCRIEYAQYIWKYCEQFKNATTTWPAPGYYEISSGFGMRVHPTEGYEKMHEGIDIPMDYGASVVSVSSGLAYVNDASGYGLYVVVKDGIHEYLYGHLQDTVVVSGEAVVPGQEIGKAGSSGVSTGPHLHFGVYLLDGPPIDPMLILQMPN